LAAGSGPMLGPATQLQSPTNQLLMDPVDIADIRRPFIRASVRRSSSSEQA